jgi:RNA polymerase primary sigma factor
METIHGNNRPYLVIDLEATYEGPEAKAAPPVVVPMAPPPVEVAPPAPTAAVGNGAADGEPRPEGEGDDEDDYENALSLAAMEAELKPKVLETFDNIAATYKKLRKLQDKIVEMQVVSEQFTRQQQRGYDKLRDEIIGYVKSLSLNNARIESLVEQLYSINKRLVALESRLMRLADSYGVPRQNFIDEYFGNELDQTWIERMGNAGNRSGAVHQAEGPIDHREDIHAGLRDGPGDHRVPPHRQGRAEGRREARQAKKRWRPTCVSSSRSPRSHNCGLQFWT